MPKLIEQKNIDDFEKGPIRRSLFDNGAVVMFHHAKGFAGAKVNLTFMAGSQFESATEHGLAHLIEHLVFKENKTNYLHEIELAGAEINAYTYKENICFELKCLSRKIPVLLPIFLKYTTVLDFTDEQLEKEKKVVIQELREDQDDHETFGIEYLFEKNFKPSLGHPIGGKPAQVKHYTRADVQRFFKKNFTSDRLILTIVSGEDFPDLENQISDLLQLGGRTKPPYRLKTSFRDKRLSHVKSHLKRDVESSILFYAFNGPSINSAQYYDYAVLDEIFFEGLSSVFFKRFREESPLVYGLGSSINPFSYSGSYLMVFNTQKKLLKQLESKFAQTMQECIDKGFEEAHIDQIKERMEDSWALAFDSVEERAEFIQDNEIYQLNEYSFKAMRKKLNKVTAKSVQKLCKKLYTSDYSRLRLVSKKG